MKNRIEKYEAYRKGGLCELFEEKNSVKNRIILMGGPEYNNLGDHAIAYATRKFFERNFTQYSYVEITENEIDFNLRKLRAFIKNTDILLLQGGGNLGNVYEDQQRIRKKVISAFPDNRILLMPQTCYFSNDGKGAREQEKTVQLFRGHTRLTLFAREQYSFEKMAELFDNEIYLTPDIVLSLGSVFEKKHKQGVAICLREDKEGVIDNAAKKWLLDKCGTLYTGVLEIDTCVNGQITKEERENALLKLWKLISEKELLITDRLHGMIFAAITQTPCVALSNNNTKIVGVYQWLKSFEWIAFCDNPYNLENCILKVRNATVCRINLESDFSKIKEKVEEIDEKVY